MAVVERIVQYLFLISVSWILGWTLV